MLPADAARGRGRPSLWTINEDESGLHRHVHPELPEPILIPSDVVGHRLEARRSEALRKHRGHVKKRAPGSRPAVLGFSKASVRSAGQAGQLDVQHVRSTALAITPLTQAQKDALFDKYADRLHPSSPTGRLRPLSPTFIKEFQRRVSGWPSEWPSTAALPSAEDTNRCLLPALRGGGHGLDDDFPTRLSTPRVDRRTALRQLSVGAFAANGTRTRTRDGGPKMDAAAATPAAVATRAPAGACILPALRGGGDGLDAAVTAVSQPAAAEAAALAAITGAGKAALQPPLVLAPRGQAKRQWAWYEGSARRSSRALRKKRKARALRAKKVAEAIADGRGEDDLPGQQVPCGAHRWIGGRRAGALP